MKTFLSVSIILFFQFQISTLQYSAHIADLENEYGKLIHVSVLFRHGDRSPCNSYPKDPYKHFPWPDGFGQLTKAGKRRMYEVGKWYRRRYSKLIKQIRSHTNITVRSSNKDRAIMSAQCFLAGFYPTHKKQFLNKFLHWQPIPIHTMPLEYDNVLAISKKNKCPMKQYYERKFCNRASTKKLYDKHEETFRFLQNHTGYSFPRNDILKTIKGISHVYDALLVQNQNNFTLPFWTQKIFPRPLLTLKEDFSLEHKPTALYPKLKRLMAGPFVASVVTNMIEKSKNYSTKIFHLYSSHDHVIRYVSMVLNFSDTVTLPYGSGLMFELRRREGKTHTVSVFFANSTAATPYPLPIPHCKAPCTLEKFIKFTRPFIPKDWKSECRLKKRNESANVDVTGA